MKASQWIDRVKLARGWDSDYRVAKELGIRSTTISNYRSGSGTLDEKVTLKVAEALSIDPVLILADQAMERAKDAEARGAWATILQRLGGVAVGVLVAVGAASPPSSQAAQTDPDGYRVYIMLSRKRRRAGVMGAMVDALLPSRKLLATG